MADLDSDDSDLFVEFQLKLSKRLTHAQSLKMKNNVLREVELSFAKQKNNSTSSKCIDIVDLTTENDIEKDMYMVSKTKKQVALRPRLNKEKSKQVLIDTNKGKVDSKTEKRNVKLKATRTSMTPQKKISSPAIDGYFRRIGSSGNARTETPSQAVRCGSSNVELGIVKETSADGVLMNSTANARHSNNFSTNERHIQVNDNTAAPLKTGCSISICKLSVDNNSSSIISPVYDVVDSTTTTNMNINYEENNLKGNIPTLPKTTSSHEPLVRNNSVDSVASLSRKESMGSVFSSPKTPTKITDFFSKSPVGVVDKSLQKSPSVEKSPNASASETAIKNNMLSLSNKESQIQSGDKLLKPSSVEKSPKPSNSETENITLSPGIRRSRKRFKSVAGVPSSPSYKSKASPSPSPTRKSPTRSSPVAPRRKLFSVPPFSAEEVAKGTAGLPEGTKTADLENKTQFDYEILGLIIRDVLQKQELLERMVSHIGEKQFFPLLSDLEKKVMLKYTLMDIKSQTLYMRMFFRKNSWHRASTLKYDDLGPNMLQIILDLKREGFFDMDIERDNIPNQLQLLKIDELRSLCKAFNIVNSNVKKKEDLIEALLLNMKQQRCVSDMFKSIKKSSRLEEVQIRTQGLLGPCFHLNDTHRKAISRALLLFSLVHNVPDETKRATSQRFMLFQVIAGVIRFVPYVVTPTVIFQTRDDFLKYETAIELRKDFEEALQNKEYDAFISIQESAFEFFKILLDDKAFCERVSGLPSYLRRYSAGSIYGSILTQCCENFKRKTNNVTVIDILSTLLGQKVFCTGSRGKWYELLTQAYESSHMFEEAINVILNGSQDECVSDVWRCFLQIRAQKLLKSKKIQKINNQDLRFSLDEFATLSVQEPASIEINGKALAGNITGSKLVYIQETSAGKRYSSVEEQAIYYYKRNGFTEGIHEEGFVVSHIFFLLFFNIIYAPSTPGIFQSSFQEQPLDLYSTSFYKNRKVAIDDQLKEMASWTMKDVADRIENVFAEYSGVVSVITWKEYFTPLLFCEIIECIGIPGVVKICERFIYNPRQARSGFPDLTLWNTETKVCKFVEVKSPNDRLSPKQRVWMDYLNKAGLDCEVCNVKNIAAKKGRVTSHENN